MHAAQCSLCPLANNPQNKHSNMPADGSTKPEVYLLGLGPGADEDAIGKPFVGKSGKFLQSCFSESQWSRTRRNNVTRTRDFDNSPPPEAVECCRPSVEKDILETKPKAIFGFGQYPLQWVLGDKYNGQLTMNTWRNRHLPISIKGHEMWFFPMFHPSYIIRSERTAPELVQVFKRDIKTAYDFLAKDIKPTLIKSHTYYDGIEIEYKSIAKIEAFICNLLKTSNRFAIDIETAADLPPGHNIPRPYHANSRILSISIGTFDKCMAFPLDHPEAKWTLSERKKLDLLILKLLLSNLTKIAHNSVYELEWLLYKYSKKIAYKNWVCTLTQGYILDGRRGLLGLGDLTLLYFEFNLKQLSNVNAANLVNTPIEDVLTYNSIDSKYTDAVYLHQQKLLEEDPVLLEVFERQNRKLPATVLMQIKGITPDLDEARKIDKEVEIKIHRLLDDISHHKDVKEYISRFGGFNANSPQDVVGLFKYLGFDMSKEVVSKTDSGRKVETKDSSDEETLSKIEHPIAKSILEIRKLINKLKSTYLDSFIGKENNVYPDGKLHPYFNVNSTATLRLSSNAPNFQNFPKHTDEAIVRKIIKAPPGYKLVSLDYGQIEYRTGVMNSKDPTLIKAIFTNYDIHKDWAIRIAKAYPKRVGGDLKAFLNDPKAIKELRQITKSGWTFAGMFNATPKTKAEYMEIPLEIAKKLDKEFWAELKTLKDWQNRMYDFVAKNGYIETLTHYRRKYGKKTPYLESGEIVNTPIQESAATIVMDSFCRICEFAIETNQEKYIPIWQIHDDLGFIFPEETLEEDYNKIAYMMLNCNFSFINVPLSVEISTGDNWYQMKEVKIIDSVDIGLMENPFKN